MPDESHNLVELPGSARSRLEAATPAWTPPNGPS